MTGCDGNGAVRQCNKLHCWTREVGADSPPQGWSRHPPKRHLHPFALPAPHAELKGFITGQQWHSAGSRTQPNRGWQGKVGVEGCKTSGAEVTVGGSVLSLQLDAGALEAAV